MSLLRAIIDIRCFESLSFPAGLFPFVILFVMMSITSIDTKNEKEEATREMVLSNDK